MSRAEMLSSLNQPAFYADPYPVYAALRAEDPVLLAPLRGGSWLFTGYADVAAGLKLEQLSNGRAGAFMTALPAEVRDDFKPLAETLSRWLLFYDPPRHTRIRKLMAKAFTQISMERLRARIEGLVTRLLDAVQPSGRMDLIKDLAYELPLLVIIELLGVPVEKKADFVIWSGNIGKLLGGAVPSLELARQTQRSVVEMTEYLREQVSLRRRRPADDILTMLIQAEEDGEMLTEDELYAQCVLLLFAGHETTRNLIGNGALALLKNPGEMERLRRDPSLVKGAVEELLRYDSPVQMISRVVKQDFEYAGKPIQKGQYAMLFLGAANRDPAQFADPDRLDITRAERGQLSFGYGPHVCIGAQLGRLEGQITFTALLERMPDMKLAIDNPEFAPNLVLRGLQALPVTFSPGKASSSAKAEPV
jgi:cytochrome P450